MHEARWEDEGGLVLPDDDSREIARERLEQQRAELDRAIASLESQPEAPVVLQSSPSEESLVTVALLMRIYDIQMALLSEVNKDLADEIYDTHAAGGHFNPQIFIPKVSTEEEASATPRSTGP